MSSSTVNTNCSGIGVCVADEAAMILAPFEGGGGGPVLDGAVCNGACGGCPCPPLMLNRGIPPEGGGAGG